MYNPTILMIRGWNKGELKFERDPILLEDEDNVIYKVMNK